MPRESRRRTRTVATYKSIVKNANDALVNHAITTRATEGTGVFDWGSCAMARVQLARAEHLAAEDAAGLSSCEPFLGLWKDADDDVPLYKQARAEYRDLRTRHPR